MEQALMKILAVVAALIATGATLSASSAESFAEVVRQIRSADYRGARADLERLA
jgi:hypothetical protein